MKAMILAAGFGTRLRPLTDLKPKALVPIINKPIIGHTIDYLKAHGINSIVVNAHHHHQQLTEYLDKGRSFGVDIEVLVEQDILGTGGGIKNSSHIWDDDPFIVINSDILTNIDLSRAYESHKISGCIATLVLHNYDQFNQISIDSNRKIKEFNAVNNRNKLAFTCIHIVQPELLSYIPDSGPFDIIDCYRNLLKSGISVNAYISKDHYWRDIGHVDSYFLSNKEMLGGSLFNIAPDLIMDPDVNLNDWGVIGNKVILEKNVTIQRSILWNNVIVKKGVTIKDSIITSSKKVSMDLSNEVY